MKLNNKSMNDNANTLDNLKGKDGVFVSVEFSSFSGKKSEKTSKVLSAEGADVSEVTDKPRKFLVNTKHLSFVQKYYQRCKRMLDRAGLPVWGGWLIAADEFELVKSRFEMIVESYDRESSAFVSSYEALLVQQCQERPELASFIRKDAPTANDVSSRFFMKMSPPMAIVIGGITNEESLANENLLNTKLILEFQMLSESVLQKIGRGDVVGQKAVSFLQDMEEKAAKFSFLDPIWAGLAGTLNSLRLSLPKSGPLDTKSVVILRMLLTSLANEKSLAAQLGSFQELGLEGAAEQEMDSMFQTQVDADQNAEEQKLDPAVAKSAMTVDVPEEVAGILNQLRDVNMTDAELTAALAQIRQKFCQNRDETTETVPAVEVIEDSDVEAVGVEVEADAVEVAADTNANSEVMEEIPTKVEPAVDFGAAFSEFFQ